LSNGVVSFGAVRDSRVTLTVTHADLMPRRVRVEFLRDSGVVALDRRWPDDFDVAPSPAGHEGRLVIEETATLTPFSRVEVRGEDRRRYAKGEAFSLTNLYGFTQEGCFDIFAKSNTRPRDPETLAFACQQVRDHYRLDPTHRHMISVIFAYRALDFGKRALLKEAAAWLEAELAVEPVAPDRLDGPASHQHRIDPVHQHVSMAMALWMCQLSLGRHAKMTAALDRAVRFLRGLKTAHGLHALNGVRMIFMRAYVHHLQGQAEPAIALSEFAFDFYKRCVAVANPDVRTFREMKESHHVALLGLLLIRAEGKGDTLDPKGVFEAVHRLREPAGIKRLKEQFLGLVAACQAPQEAPPVPRLSKSARLELVRAHRKAIFEGYAPLDGRGLALVGDSLIDFADWNALLPREPTRNLGIRGDTAERIHARRETVLRLRPGRILLMVGANDIGEGVPSAVTAEWVARTLAYWRAEAPETPLIVHAVLPRGDDRRAAVVELNTRLRATAEAAGAAFVDASAGLVSETGGLTAPWSKDGVHLLRRGYETWVDTMRPTLIDLGVDAAA
jgi:lysophospholipase L1-like esterase